MPVSISSKKCRLLKEPRDNKRRWNEMGLERQTAGSSAWVNSALLKIKKSTTKTAKFIITRLPHLGNVFALLYSLLLSLLYLTLSDTLFCAKWQIGNANACSILLLFLDFICYILMQRKIIFFPIFYLNFYYFFMHTFLLFIIL